MTLEMGRKDNWTLFWSVLGRDWLSSGQMRRLGVEGWGSTKKSPEWGWGAVWGGDRTKSRLFYLSKSMHEYKMRCYGCCCLVSKSCLTLWDTTNCSPPSSSVHEGFPGQEFWCGLPFPPPGILPDPGIKSMCPLLTDRFFTIDHQGSKMR